MTVWQFYKRCLAALLLNLTVPGQVIFNTAPIDESLTPLINRPLPPSPASYSTQLAVFQM